MGIILALIVVASLIYTPNRNVLHVSDKEKYFDGHSSITQTDSNSPSSLKVGAKSQPAAGKMKKEESDNFEAFDRMERTWLERVQKIIEPKLYPIYLELRERNEKEKMQAYKEFHNYLKQKYGDKFSYNISEDQSVLEKKINERYMNELLAMIGREKFMIYLKARDQFNEEMRRQGKLAIQIEF